MKTHYSDCKVTGKGTVFYFHITFIHIFQNLKLLTEEEKVPEKIIIVNEDSNPEVKSKLFSQQYLIKH